MPVGWESTANGHLTLSGGTMQMVVSLTGRSWPKRPVSIPRVFRTPATYLCSIVGVFSRRIGGQKKDGKWVYVSPYKTADR
jgi:hypothetical protein